MRQVIWDEQNIAHLAEHGLTPDEVDEVICNDLLPVAESDSSGLPCRFGWTSTGKHIIAIWTVQNVDPEIVYPVTAFEVEPPRPKRRRKRQ